MKNYAGAVFNGCHFVRRADIRVSALGNRSYYAIWRCTCGMEFKASIGNVTSGQVKSCGCKRSIATIQRCTKHGHSPNVGASRLYRFWQSMKDRCLNPLSWNFCNYGGRGIAMHPAWVSSFPAFEAWFNRAFNCDEIPAGLSMDRINNDGPYRPGNLRLATWLVQANNRRGVRKILFHGRVMSISELARKVGKNRKTIWSRIVKQHKTLEEAIA